MSTETVLLQGVMYFEYSEQGWSEKVYLSGSEYAPAMTKLNALAVLRLKILPVGAKLVYARVNSVGNPRDKRALPLTYPLVGGSEDIDPPVATSCNDVEFAQVISMETVEGRWATHFLRCIPDDMVVNRTLPSAITIPGTGLTNTGTTWMARLGDYLALLRDTTVYARVLAPLTGPPPVPQYDVRAWVAIIDRGLRKKNTGRPFGLSRGRAPVR